MNVELCTSVDERLDVPVVLPPMLDLLDIRGMRVLIADDVADTGKTLELVRKPDQGPRPVRKRRDY
jgi:uncharacterized protein